MTESPTPPIIEAREVQKFYSQPDGHLIEVIGPTSMRVLPDQIFVLLGPSGCGKSSMLRMLSGLSTPSAGEITWHGHPVTGDLENIGIVFQSFALFPWLTVLQNVEAPLRARGVPPIERRKRALRILDTVGLDGFETAYPKELSGGMKQRVGFARALVVEPEVLFMDEAFSALDVLTAENLRSELLDLWLERKIPTRAIFIVTHNIEEAVFLGDRITVLGGKPAGIISEFDIRLTHPRDRKDRAFLGIVDDVYKVLTRRAPAAPAPQPRMAQSARVVYPALPHARPGGIAGILEILSDRGGHEDLYRLADDLAMDVDDLLPIVDAAALLDFMKVTEGDVTITPQGMTFYAADIPTQKVLFREAALKNVPILAQIAQALKTKSDRTLPMEFFHDILDEHFTEAESQRQMETLINWGRYGEIFDYDADTERVSISSES